ncbi:hypothetical protein KOI35_38550 [Actinoplanes bogorensis]|uniref:Uncharacterized protein n=1 Tax=Paractinoplanes bogorensis TaxID=1610840 RepID=A0ABS5Z158_9ACTN|nr:hypothetical protein [Actinoplanes bogorensis]MBU2669430.1 hypothetical protein [Actinoplanes bogorensis]
MPDTLELLLVARNDRYDDEDPRWLDQIADLTGDLRRETEALRRTREAVPGTKGMAEQLVLALGTAGAFHTTLEVVRAWLARDRHRALTITVTSADGAERTVVVSARNASRDAWQPLIDAAAKLSRDEE